MRGLALALVWTLGAWSAAWALGQAPQAPRRGPVVSRVSAGPDTAAIGQTIRAVYEVRTPRDAKVQFPPQPADDSTWTWQGWKVEKPIDTPQGVRHRVTAQVLAFRTGARSLPAPAFRVRPAGGRVASGRFPQLTLTIRSVLPQGDPPDIKDLKPVFPSPWWATFPWWIVAAVLALVLLIVYLLLRKKKPVVQETREARVVTPAVPAHVEALAALEALVRENLPGRGLWKEHQTRLAAIVRRFLERRFSSPEPGYTTRELLLHLAWRGIVSADIERLRALLRIADLTKFARGELTPEVARQQEQEARTLITALAEPAAAPADAPASLPKAG